ncbi:TSSC1-like protein [Fimicolochytrium jonesii]|uniref:TSSC1-like protein n=1 Tax=Fimicolochytrium jonesii TaxID=1396493 RepID=UPI0022FDE7D7|nr:TSSC1-like protein [Fimicolochytrium jonesii]KAI8824028.1 TSSC1-like protein [Fimicolochytrium jonesii]
METEGGIYGLTHQARCLKAQSAEQERSRFFVGTQDLKQTNELHLIDFDEDESIITSHKLEHPHEVRDIAPSGSKADLVATVSKEANHPCRARLWQFKLPEPDEIGKLRNDSGTLDKITEFASTETLGEIRHIYWDPLGTENSLVALSPHSLGVFAVREGAESISPQSTIRIIEPKDPKRQSTCASWSPHGSLIAAGTGTSVHAFDIRSSKQTYEIPQAHAGTVRDIDHNSNKPYQLATGGDDCKIRFWDTRNVAEPIKEVSNHSHWVWSVRFNRFHDQLFLSAGSDCKVNLHSIISISSAPLSDESSDAEDDAEDEADEYRGKPTDGLVAVFDQQHEDSVYAAEWSAADPWIFASLSYDGRVAVNLVPREHKYKIIL